MIGTHKLITGITVTHKVGSNDDSDMVSQFSSPPPPLPCLSSFSLSRWMIIETRTSAM